MMSVASNTSNAGRGRTPLPSRFTKCRAALHVAGTGSFALSSRCAADSIGDNIVEGCGAATKKDFARFLDNSIKSANETEGHLLKTRDLGLISLDERQQYSAETIEVRKMVFGYRRKVIASDTT
jgi:four helix bundle protein